MALRGDHGGDLCRGWVWGAPREGGPHSPSTGVQGSYTSR